jgi:hypothetical protein
MILNMKSVGLVALLLVSCSGADVPRTKGDVGNQGSKQGADGTPAGEENPAQLAARDAAEAVELANLKEANQKLCERLQKVRSECAATYRLIPTESDKTLACTLGNETKSLAVGEFEISFDADGRQYRLLADNNWESSPFGNGTTKITWKPRLESSTEAPRMLEVTSLILKPDDGGRVGSVGGMALRAGGFHVVGNGDLRSAQESQGYYVVSLQGILDIRKSSRCTLSQDEVNALVGAVGGSK